MLGLISIYVADSLLHLGLFSHNSIEVTAEGDLDSKKIVVRKGLYSINRNSDEDLFNGTFQDEIVFKDENSWGLATDYGENDFLIIYDDEYYYQFRHFIFNRQHSHDYKFHLIEQDKGITLSVSIEGKDGMKFTRKMNRISEISKLKTNVPIEDAGTIYNMKELVRD